MLTGQTQFLFFAMLLSFVGISSFYSLFSIKLLKKGGEGNGNGLYSLYPPITMSNPSLTL